MDDPAGGAPRFDLFNTDATMRFVWRSTTTVATGEVRSLGLLLAGDLLVWPAVRSTRTNRPGSYNPAQTPDMIG